ncbi:hypothetical protein BpHYR1_033676 [Brachionus plicatilis]|uniref:Uncharacterized protein n=1 Tax=Brachionus plicatilis TaxID=10195 RepID=A0A3M7Q8V4_BRAPC|nr:hypothetical protein BpHYR1_033676 [Brachionus plicatilis]
MDPVKEKLNLLKKLASEKKSSNQGGKMPDMSDKKKSTNRKNSVPRELSGKDMELNSKQVEVLEAPREIDFDLFSFHNSKKEEEDFPIEENSASLIVFDDIDKIESSESNMDIKMLNTTNTETNSNYRLNANPLSSVKSQQHSNKSFTIGQQHEPTSKYINRIRDMYDKERALSTECINSLKPKGPLQRQGSSIKKINEAFSPQKLLTPQHSLQSDHLEKSEKSAPLASPEVLRDFSVNDSDQEEPSIMSSNNGSVRHQTPSQRSQSYITHLRNTFNAHSVRSDSIEIAKRNSFVPESSHQIERIKEKFFKINQPNQRNSYMHPGEMNKFASHYKSLRSLKAEELQPESTKVEQLVKNLNQEAKKNEPKPKKQIHKYQKSVTSDLSSFILERDKEIEYRKAEQAREFEDMDKRLIDKYSKDARYAAESAIIKSSLSKAPTDQKILSHLKDEETNKAAEPAESSRLSNPIVSAIAPIMKRTKSILKSPSTFSEKTIHFDDKIDIIPIDRTTDDNSPVPFNSQSYENLDQFSSYSSFRPVVAKSNEIEFLKKNYENYDNYRWEYFKDLSPLRNHALATNSARERIFVKSPTPMREIVHDHPSPPSAEFPSSSFNRLLEINEDRTRFPKRTNSASFRSQSADLSKLAESSSRHNFSPDSNLLPRDRPVPQLIASNARPNLTRQNALSKTFAKSLVEGMNKTHDSRKQEFKEHVPRSHRKKNRRKIYRRNRQSSSLTSSLSEIDSSELSQTESTSSFSSSSYEQKFEPRSRVPRANNVERNKKNAQCLRRNTGKKLIRHAFYSSDDSVCGIPKSSVKLANKSSK